MLSVGKKKKKRKTEKTDTKKTKHTRKHRLSRIERIKLRHKHKIDILEKIKAIKYRDAAVQALVPGIVAGVLLVISAVVGKTIDFMVAPMTHDVVSLSIRLFWLLCQVIFYIAIVCVIGFVAYRLLNDKEDSYTIFTGSLIAAEIAAILFIIVHAILTGIITYLTVISEKSWTPLQSSTFIYKTFVNEVLVAIFSLLCGIVVALFSCIVVIALFHKELDAETLYEKFASAEE